MEQTTTQAEGFDGWGVVDLFGHKRLAGRLSEQTIAGAVMLRIDVPQEGDRFVTSFYNVSAVYSVVPTDEATARQVAAHYRPQPISSYELLPEGSTTRGAARREIHPEDDDYGNDL